MKSNRGTQTNAANDNARVSPSWRDSGALSGTLAGVSFVGGVAGAMTLADSPYPRPGSEPEEIRRYFRGNPGAARLSVAGQLISAASLARFTASVAKLAGRSGRGSRGLRLVGSLGLAGLRTGDLPRPLALAGLASAAAGTLSPLYFVWEPAAWFIPAGRFSGLLVCAIDGVVAHLAAEPQDVA
jgi:hypothetical protein